MEETLPSGKTTYTEDPPQQSLAPVHGSWDAAKDAARNVNKVSLVDEVKKTTQRQKAAKKKEGRRDEWKYALESAREGAEEASTSPDQKIRRQLVYEDTPKELKDAGSSVEKEGKRYKKAATDAAKDALYEAGSLGSRTWNDAKRAAFGKQEQQKKAIWDDFDLEKALQSQPSGGRTLPSGKTTYTEDPPTESKASQRDLDPPIRSSHQMEEDDAARKMLKIDYEKKEHERKMLNRQARGNSARRLPANWKRS